MNETAEAQPSDRCPRCGGGFHCGINETKPCACAGVRLEAGLLRRLRQLHGDRCLCLRCLQALADGAAP
jgi:Cysteine-rich CWC